MASRRTGLRSLTPSERDGGKHAAKVRVVGFRRELTTTTGTSIPSEIDDTKRWIENNNRWHNGKVVDPRRHRLPRPTGQPIRLRSTAFVPTASCAGIFASYGTRPPARHGVAQPLATHLGEYDARPNRKAKGSVPRTQRYTLHQKLSSAVATMRDSFPPCRAAGHSMAMVIVATPGKNQNAASLNGSQDAIHMVDWFCPETNHVGIEPTSCHQKTI